jgi:hypothetical protein
MEERFLKHVDKTGENECWLWTAYKIGGYGQFALNKKSKLAHRVAYTLWIGEIPDGLIVRHKCNNPPCVNPNHLEIGTHQDNMNDMVRAGRQAFQKGEKNGRVKLTRDQVETIRSRVGLLRELAQEFGVSQQQISRIQSHKRWI